MLKKDQHENLVTCGPFDAKTTNQTALAASLVCQKDQTHESAVAVRLIVRLPVAPAARKLNMIRGNTVRRHLLCHPALGYLFPAASLSLSERQVATERGAELEKLHGSGLDFRLLVYDLVSE